MNLRAILRPLTIGLAALAITGALCLLAVAARMFLELGAEHWPGLWRGHWLVHGAAAWALAVGSVAAACENWRKWLSHKRADWGQLGIWREIRQAAAISLGTLWFCAGAMYGAWLAAGG